MPHWTERRRARWTFASLGGALAALGSCIDTHLEDAEPQLPCSVQASTASAAEALVWIRVNLKDIGYRYCSAVAVSPRLVLTTYSCVAYPGDLDREAASGADEARFPVDRQTYFDPVEYQAFCDDAQGWTPIEDGSFRSRLSAPVALADIGVGRAGDVDRPTLGVDVLLAAGSSSRCNEGIALLLLSEDLKVVDLPLRLEDSADAGEPVLTSGIVAAQGRFVRRDQPGLIQSVTRERGNASLPPQSLLLETTSCYLSRGGPVLSETSGALVALVAWGQSASCDDGTAGTTVAIRLAPYRSMLMTAAASHGQTLYSERRIGSDAEVVECEALPESQPPLDP